MKKENRPKKGRGITRMKRRNGLIALLIGMILLSGCEMLQESEKIKPDYTRSFLNCVADEMEAQNYGECTEKVVTDWLVMIE